MRHFEGGIEESFEKYFHSLILLEEEQLTWVKIDVMYFFKI